MPKKLDFITPTVMKVLNFFFSHPTGEFHEREVMRKTKISKGSANKILRQLSKLDFLTREKRGRMVFYKLQMRNPVVRQFKILNNIYELSGLLDEIKEKCRKVILFGSCAKGTDVGESDIDLFVLTSQRDFIRRKISKFNIKSKRRIAPIIIDANELVKMKKGDRPLYDRVREGIVLWETG